MNITDASPAKGQKPLSTSELTEKDIEEMGDVLLGLGACLAYLTVLCLTYGGELKREKRRPVMLLGCAVLTGLTAAKGAHMAAVCFLPENGLAAVSLGLFALTMLFHRWYVQAKTRSESGTALLARVLWSVCAGIFSLYLHISVLFSSGLERGVCIMILIAMAGSTAARRSVRMPMPVSSSS